LILRDVLEHINRKKAIKEIKRVLKPNGLLIIATPSLHTNWIHKIAEVLKLGEMQVGGSEQHSLFDLKEIPMK